MSLRNRCVAVIVSAAMTLVFAACTKNAEAPPAPALSSAAATAPPPGGVQQGGASPDSATPALQAAHAPVIAPSSDIPPAGDSPHGMLTWETPSAWTQEQPSNSMRMAQYSVPAAAGDAAGGECVVFYFGPGQGGDAPSNAARWVSMFTKPDGGPVEGKVTEQKIGERLVTRVEAAGAYQPASMMMGGSPQARQPGSMLLGAIVPGADANWFFRCVGPQKTIAANRAAFDGLIASLK